MYDYEWCDYKKVEAFYNERCRKYMGLSKRFIKAKEKGDKEGVERASKAILKHRDENEKFKERAKESYFYWY